MTAWADHGETGNGEPLAIVLRPGNAGSNTAADHIEAARLAVAQLPRHLRRRVLVRADSGGGTHKFLKWLTAKSRRLHYSVGMVITEAIAEAIGQVPADAWTPACDGDGEVRRGAWVADVTGLPDLYGWPAGMRVIVRKERPHPGAQLRFTDIGGHRFTAFATDTRKGQLAVLELRHRRRARCEEGSGTPRTPGCGTCPEGVRAEPGLVRDRRAGLRAAGLGPDARPGRHRPPLGAQAAPPARLRRRRPSGARRPPPAAKARAELALGCRDRRRRYPPAGPPVRLTSRNSHHDQEGEPQGPWNPAHPARQPGSRARPEAGKQPRASASGRRLRGAKDRG
jgi:hypothetical protein